MYQYIENVSMCRYKYILKVSDTYTVSDTKGLICAIIQEEVFSLKSCNDYEKLLHLGKRNELINGIFASC